MLMGQERGRHQDGHLAIFFHGFECGPHRHFGLAVPHVAADQAVHRFGGSHVIRNVFDRLALVRCFLVLKGRFKLVVEHAVFAVGVPVDQLPIGIEIDEFMRHFFDVFFDPRGGLGPAGAAQPVQSRDVGIGSRIPLHLVQPIERHIELVSTGEFEHQEVAVEILHREAAQSLIFCNAVLHVDDIVADVQILQRREERGRLALGCGLWRAPFANSSSSVRTTRRRSGDRKPAEKSPCSTENGSLPVLWDDHTVGVHGSAGKSCSRSRASKRSTCPRLRATKMTRCSFRSPSNRLSVWLKAVPLIPSPIVPGAWVENENV